MSNTEIKLHEFHGGQDHIASNRSKRTLMRCGRRFGKALSVDTPIPTPEGWVLMGDIMPGDIVFDEDGKQCNVTFVTEIQTNRPCNKVIFSDGSELIADDSHQWLTWDRCARKNAARNSKKVRVMDNHKKFVNDSPKIRTTKEIRETLLCGCRGDTNHSIKNCLPIICAEKELLISPYLLGCWIGDGVSGGAIIVCDDYQIIEEIIKEDQPVTKLPQPFMYSLTDGTRRYKLDGSTLQSRFKKLKLINNKHIPCNYLRASYSQRMALFQGLMDTDGTVGVGGHCEYTSINKKIADGVLEIALSLGIRAVMYTGRATLYGKDCGEKYRVHFTTDLPVFRLQRKLDRILSRKSDRNITHRFIVDVIPIKSVPVKCIQVDSKNSLYLAGEAFIPTHNTTMFEDLACLFAIEALSVGWFSPKYKYMQGSFRRIRKALKPLIVRSSITDGIIELTTGGIIRFWTMEDPDCGRGDFYHEVLIDEASLVKKGMRDIWEQSIAPTLLDFDGNAWMAGTPKGVDPDNFFYFAATNKDLTQGQLWKEFHAPTMSNPAISVKAIAEFKEQLPPLVYQQEILAEFIDWSGTAFFSLDKMLVDGLPVQYPPNCTNILVILDTAVKDKKDSDATAAIYCAYVQFPEPRLIILDYDLLKIEGASLITWLPEVYARAEQYAVQCKARNGKMVFIEDKASGMILLQQLRNEGIEARPIPEEFVSLGKTERAIAVSGHYFQEKIKISKHSYNKVVNLNGITKNHLISQIVGFRLGIDAGAATDDSLDTFTYSLLIAFGKM